LDFKPKGILEIKGSTSIVFPNSLKNTTMDKSKNLRILISTDRFFKLTIGFIRLNHQRNTDIREKIKVTIKTGEIQGTKKFRCWGKKIKFR
jgi:hypothetical protein